MEQDGLDDNDAVMDAWYSQYLSAKNIDAVSDSIQSEPLDLQAVEDQILEAMNDANVVAGFCSPCQAMLDNWPDFEAYTAEQRLEEDSSESDAGSSLLSVGSSATSQFWLDPIYGITASLPCQAQAIGLMAAARNGCRCCGLILQCMKDRRLLEVYMKTERRLRRLGKFSQISLVLREWDEASYLSILGFPGMDRTRVNSVDVGVYIHIFPHLENSPQPHSAVSLRSPETNDQSLMLASHWTKTCLASHQLCNDKQTRQYPRRLLSIAKDSVRLVQTIEWPDRPHYATLSHCWGNNKFLKLLTTNLEELQRCIPADSLTKTFNDAIQISRTAGITYLWIDSLCIVQDNHHDWEVESSRMASIYGGSSLNIAASSARDGTEGCFLRPDEYSGGFVAEICIGGQKRACDFIQVGEYSYCVSETHLSSRGWAIQEKVLAPRTLHCGDRGLFWECRTDMASEYFPDGFIGARRQLSPYSLLLHPNRLADTWDLVRDKYITCDLTYPEDKLVALSGVARAVSEMTGDQYVAGLWRKNLEVKLCWRVSKPQPKPPYRAPSWSWAAVDGPDYDLMRYTYSASDTAYVHVRSVSVTNTGVDPFGAVSDGSLLLDCEVVREGIVGKFQSSSKTKEEDFEPSPWTCLVDLGREGHGFPFELDCAEEVDVRLGQVVYFVPLQKKLDRHCHRERWETSVIDSQEMIGIVLEAVDSSKLTYRRIGSFDYRSCNICPAAPLWKFEEIMGMNERGATLRLI